MLGTNDLGGAWPLVTQTGELHFSLRTLPDSGAGGLAVV